MISRWFLFLLALASASACLAQTNSPAIEPRGAAHAPNSNAVYMALRNIPVSGEGLTVKDFTLQREGASFHFTQGTFYLYGEVNGRVTGAVFQGTGHFELAPKEASEQHSLSLLTKSGVMSQDFTTLVLRFTDDTVGEIRKVATASAGVSTSQVRDAAHSLAAGFQHTMHQNLELLLLDDVLAARNGGFFLASFRMGGIFSGRNILFIVDPAGAPNAAPDEVELSTWGDEGVQTWAAYRLEHHAQDASLFHVSDEKIDTTFEKSGKMHSSIETTLQVHHEGLRVVPFHLFPTLRVAGVYNEAGDPLDFIQEDKNNDPDFAVVLPSAAPAGTTVRLLTKYAGSDALRRDGEGVYYLLSSARDSWYPSAGDEFGDYIKFHMTFHLPKNLQIIATGKQTSATSEPGGQRVVWETQSPIPVAGFNLGDFKSSSEKTPQGFEVTAYANINLPDNVSNLANGSLGSLSATSSLKDEVSQGNAAIQIYSDFFGKLPYDHVALTEQSACNYGQSWPMLVYLPICAFWDTTVQHALGLSDFGGASYWREVTPHEVSHQWWGSLIGFKSYRDQWMSEGFANFSVGLFLMNTSNKMDDYRSFWNEQHKYLVQKNEYGVRPVDVGPLTMGQRVSNDKTGNVYQLLIYSKGAYIMHMLEMMYWTPQYKQEPFKQSLHAFVSEYAGKAATTEDFKHSFEKTMPKWVDATGDGKLDWFFNEYVYGTEVPHYTISSDFSVVNGETTIHMKLAQANVSPSFLMIVPVYLQMENGSVIRLGVMPMKGSQELERDIKIGKLPSPGKKLLLNYNADILSD